MKIKTNVLKYKDPDTGEYTPIPIVVSGDNEEIMKEITELNEKIVQQGIRVTPQMYGAKGDGIADDTNVFKTFINSLTSGEVVNLLGKTYVISDELILNNIYLTNGTIIYTGSANKRIFTIQQNSGLININVDIHTVNYASDVVFVDYTTVPKEEQWVTGNYIIDGLHICNTEETTTFVENSTCVRIRYQSYQVVWGQSINNLTLNGLMDYGIYIEPWLKRADYNPVYNTSVFSNVLFKTVNCALKTLPIVGDPIEAAVPAIDTETQGGMGLYLNRFANQSLASGMTKAFMDLHNTSVEGNMVIPWDYYGNRMPEEGIYKTFNSKVYLGYEYFHDSGERRSNSRVGWTEYETGEKFTNCNAFYLDNVGEGNPYRDEKLQTPWSIDNARMIRFSADGKTLLGIQYSYNNSDAPKGQNTVQFGFHEGFPYIRIWDKDNATWGELLPIHVNGNMPICYDDNRPDGIHVGDVKFDTSKGYPIWWTGSKWVKANGKEYNDETLDVTRTSQLINDSGFISQENLVLSSIDSDGNIYEGYGYKNSQRINSNGGVSGTVATSMATGFISVSADTSFTVTGCKSFTLEGVNNVIAVYDEHFTFLGSFTGNNNNYGVFANILSGHGREVLQEFDGGWTWRVPSGANIAYVRISANCVDGGILFVSFESSTVKSVNGKTGQVRLTAEDVGALPSSILVTPQMYGAKGDGIHDDTIAFHNALAEHNSVFVPKGDYLITDTLDISYKKSLVSDDGQRATIFFNGSGSIINLGRISVFRNINIRVKNTFTGVVFCTDNNDMNVTTGQAAMESIVEHTNVYFEVASPDAVLIGIKVDSGTDPNNIPTVTGICYQKYHDITVEYGCKNYGYGVKMELIEGREFTEDNKSGFPWITHIDFDDVFLGSPYTAIKACVTNTSGAEHFERIHMGHILFNNVSTQFRDAESTRFFFDLNNFGGYFTKCIAWDYHSLGWAGEKSNIIGENVTACITDCEMSFGAEFLKSCDFTAETEYNVTDNPEYFMNKYFGGTVLRDGYDSIDSKIDSKLTGAFVANIAEEKINDILYSGYANIMEDPLTQIKNNVRWSSSSKAWVDSTDKTMTIVIPVVTGGNIIRWSPTTYKLSVNHKHLYFFNDDELTSAIDYKGWDNLGVTWDSGYIEVENPSGYKYLAIPFMPYDDISSETMTITINREITGTNEKSYTEYLRDSVIVPAVEEKVVQLKTCVTPQMYGAKGDGVTDDTQAFENALAENDNVFVPKGNYLIKRPIDLTNEKTLVGSDDQSATLIYDGADTDSAVLIGRLSVFRNINITVKKAFKGVVFDTDNMKINSSTSGLNSRVEHINVVFADRSPEATLIRIIMDSGTDANNIPSLNGVCFQTYNDISVTGEYYYGNGIEMTLVQGRAFTEEAKAGFPWITHIDFNNIYLGHPYRAIKAGVNNTSGSEYFERINIGHILFNNVYTQYYTSATGVERTRYFLDVDHFGAYLTKCMAWDYHHLGLAGEKCNIIGENVNLSLNDCEMVFGVDFLESCEFTSETESGFTIEDNPSYFTNKYFKGTFLRNGYDIVDAKIDTKLASEYIGNIAEDKVNEILYSGYANILEDPRTIVKYKLTWSNSRQEWVERTDTQYGVSTLIIPVVKGGNVIRWTPQTNKLSADYNSMYLFNEDLSEYKVLSDYAYELLFTDGDDTYLMVDNPDGYPYVSIPFPANVDLSSDTMFMTINREITDDMGTSYTEYLKESVIDPAIQDGFEKLDIPTKVSDLENDSGFLTEHQDISGKADKSNAETWTFTLSDGSTVTKKVVLA